MSDNPSTTAQSLDQLGFEDAMRELQATVDQLESGALPLAEALAAYRRGAALLLHAQGLLDQVQAQIEVIESGQERSVDRAGFIASGGD
jgi:exodeoxyribonuclease VII small subunit